MVQKPNGKWHMCINFADLYHLPCIDQLVDATINHALLNFMDTYLRYNQIQMDPADEDKTAFYMHDSAYCYWVMPFGQISQACLRG